MVTDDFPDHDERAYDPAPSMLSLTNEDDRASGLNGGEAWAPSVLDYEGTGIGALYGGPMSSAQAAQLAGWTIKPRSEHE